MLFSHMNRNLSDGLCRIGVKEDSLLLAELADFADLLDRSDFVVGDHDRNKDRLWRQGASQLSLVHQPLPVDRKVGDPVPEFFELPARIEHRTVLGLNRHDVVAFLSERFCGALESQIVRLRRTRGENNFPRFGPDRFCDDAPGSFDRLLRDPSETVLPASRVSEQIRKVWKHRIQNAVIDGSRGMVVHVDGQLHQTISMIVKLSNTLLILLWSLMRGSLMGHVWWMMHSSGLSASHWMIVTVALSSIALIIAETFNS